MDAEIIRLADARRGGRHRKRRIYFDRRELNQLLQVYSDRVSRGEWRDCPTSASRAADGRGEWRDYAIDHTTGGAMFSVFRHSQDRPVYAIAKTAGPRGHEYAVFDGRCKLARTPSLSVALAVFDKRIRLVDD